jgi:hypothetical protein
VIRPILAAFPVVGLLVFAACGGDEKQPPKAALQEGRAIDKHNQDDRSNCDFKGRNDRDVQETTSPGAVQPNIRRVFAIVGVGEDARRVLLCREVDINLDGVKDVVRVYNDKGEATQEKADKDLDGRIDTWISFGRGRIAKVETDKNRDGIPDVTSHYVEGQLSRVQRDTDHDRKPDVWEIYERGRLQRMGVDLDKDGHVDRWDRDESLAREEAMREKAELEKEEKAALEAGAGENADASASGGGAVQDAGVADAPTDARVSARKR